MLRCHRLQLGQAAIRSHEIIVKTEVHQVLEAGSVRSLLRAERYLAQAGIRRNEGLRCLPEVLGTRQNTVFLLGRLLWLFLLTLYVVVDVGEALFAQVLLTRVVRNVVYVENHDFFGLALDLSVLDVGLPRALVVFVGLPLVLLDRH